MTRLLRLPIACSIVLLGAFVATRLAAADDGAPAGPVPPAGQAPAAASTAPPPDETARLEAAFAGAPQDVVLGLALQDALCSTGRRSDALAIFRRLRAQRKQDPTAGFLLGRLEGGTDGLRAMWDALDARLGLPADATAGLAEAWGALAEAESQAGRWSQAADAAAKRADLARTPLAWTDLAALRERTGDRAGAETAFRRALALDTAWMPARNGLALLLARSSRGAEALTLAKETAALVPDSAEAYIHLGLVRSLAGDKPGALGAYQRALELAKGDVAALRALAATYAEIEEHDLAKKALEQARRLGPADGSALVQGGAIALEAGDLDEASRLLAEAARALPDDGRVAFLQGVTAQRQARLDAAVVAFRRAVAAEPRNASYALALAMALQEVNKPDAAIEALEKAAELSPERYDLQLRLGFLRMDRRKWARAAEAFESAAKLQPRNPDPHFYLAVIYGDKQRMTSKAKEHLREYRRLGGQELTALRWLDELESDG